MHDILYNEIKSAINTPPMTMDSMFLKTPGSIDKFIASKQTIHFTREEIESIKSKYNLAAIVLNRGDTGTINDFSGMTDMSGISEWFGDSGVYVPSVSYHRYLTAGVGDVNITVYNAQRLARSNVVEVTQKLRQINATPDAAVEISQQINWIKYTEKRFDASCRIRSYLHPFPILSVNLPYAYYSAQSIPESIYTIDENGVYSYAGHTHDEFAAMVNEIATKGIRQKLIMQISNGKIVSADNETYLVLLIANYLKLPSIPVTLYQITNDANNMVVSNRPIDVVNRVAGLPTATEDELTIINDVVNPEMMFYVNGINTVAVRRFSAAVYASNRDTDAMSITAYNTADLYRNNGEVIDVTDASDEAVQRIHENAHKVNMDKMTAEINAVLKQYQK